MKWFDGSEIDLRQFSGETLCRKLAADMWVGDRYDASRGLPDFIRTAMYIIEFDTEANMEGFFTPFDSNAAARLYPQMIQAFRTIGDDRDAELLEEASRLAAHYKRIMGYVSDMSAHTQLFLEYDSHAEYIARDLYLHRDIPMWELLYKYLDEQIEKL